MTKKHVQRNGVWIYEVTLEGDTLGTPGDFMYGDGPKGAGFALIPVVSPSQMESWIIALNDRMGMPMPIPESQRVTS